jgi:dihydroorotase
VSPHHLVLDHEALAGYDPNLKVLPPLREPADVEALRAGVADGTIDAIATDHFPHTMDAKERPFDQAPFGVLGLETALAVLLSETSLAPERLLAAMSWQPASLAGLADQGGPIEVGEAANLAVVDPDATWTVGPGSFGGYATNSPYLGRQLQGRVRHTVYRGSPVVVDSQIVDARP